MSERFGDARGSANDRIGDRRGQFGENRGRDWETRRPATDVWRDRTRNVTERRTDLRNDLRSGRESRVTDRQQAIADGYRRADWQRWSSANSTHHHYHQHYHQHFHQHNHFYNWHRGFWNYGAWGRGHWWGGAWYAGPYWDSIWWNYPRWRHFGVTVWGINRLAWGFGYWGYVNPYCIVNPPVVVYDYAQPLVVHEQPYYIIQDSGVTAAQQVAGEQLPPGVTPEAVSLFDQALEAFRNGNYDLALDRVNGVIRETPQDAVAHEFRSLTLFALGRYDEAAEAIYAVLSVTPGWDWETMSSLYPNVDVYTQHLRALERQVGDVPRWSPGRFLLAYHYMTCGHDEAAVRQLKRVLEITPDNKVATDLLIMFEGPDAVQEIAGASPTIVPPAATVDVPEVQAGQVSGRWTAASGEASFNMHLDPDGTFRWTFTRDGRTEEMTGVWAIDGNVLAMEPTTGGVMLAEIGAVQRDRFTFKMAGAPPDDPGLNFQRSAE